MPFDESLEILLSLYEKNDDWIISFYGGKEHSVTVQCYDFLYHLGIVCQSASLR
jgi:hypothetical protein